MGYQAYEDKKNSSEFFDCESRRAYGSSPFSFLMKLEAPKSVLRG
jgi:hypothetical protein